MSHRGKDIGAGLLIDGIARAYRAEITAFATVVDAKDDAAVAFYKHNGLYQTALRVTRGIHILRRV
jgi:hypothetical protein